MDNSIKEDIELTFEVLRGDVFTDSNKLYFATNESLSDILDRFDINNKKVLTVLGSGDQAFHFYLKGAQYVDLFDINKLTLYYYYLRRWTIIYLKKSYPPFEFDSSYLKFILPIVTPNDADEEQAIEYWKEVANLLDSRRVTSYDLFHYTGIDYDEKVYDNTNLANLLNRDQICFSNVDIAQKLRVYRKYDIVYLSNIADYVNTTGSFDTFRKNLKSMLDKEGVIICSNVSLWTDHDEVEELEKDFNFHDITVSNEIDCEKQIGHYYTRKRLKERFTR